MSDNQSPELLNFWTRGSWLLTGCAQEEIALVMVLSTMDEAKKGSESGERQLAKSRDSGNVVELWPNNFIWIDEESKAANNFPPSISTFPVQTTENCFQVEYLINALVQPSHRTNQSYSFSFSNPTYRHNFWFSGVRRPAQFRTILGDFWQNSLPEVPAPTLFEYVALISLLWLWLSSVVRTSEWSLVRLLILSLCTIFFYISFNIMIVLGAKFLNNKLPLMTMAKIVL